jgi:hypothetical protein
MGPKKIMRSCSSLGSSSGSRTDKWLLLNDFNLILQASDKNNNNLNRRLMGEFRDVVRDLELKELNLRGRKFPWFNEKTQTRIDRAFCSTEWDLMMPHVYLQALSSRVSGHFPLLLASSATMQRYRGFWFEAFWLKLPRYQEVVTAAWSRHTQVINLFLKLHIKLQHKSKALRAWARGMIGRNKLLLQAANQLIAIFDVVQEYR